MSSVEPLPLKFTSKGASPAIISAIANATGA